MTDHDRTDISRHENDHLNRWNRACGPSNGERTALVLVHGADIDHRFWDVSGVRESIAEHHTVYAMDGRGHGASEDPGEFELKREFEDIVAVVDSIDEPVQVVAESGGAFYSLEAALRTDNIRTLALHEPLFQGSKALAPTRASRRWSPC
ncbi:alpha/beta fold hydrolase [Natrialba swarupiae]|nr:alpha/beta fold hydrolase [Natrialba swarupiae]